MPLGREGLRDRAEWSAVTAMGAASASASSRRASAPGTLRHYLATRLEDAIRQLSRCQQACQKAILMSNVMCNPNPQSIHDCLP